jgi:crossover junction endodeoxyribonuclease RuvC
MLVLGVDCGSESTGFGMVASDGHRHRAVISGAIRSTPAMPFAERLNRIHARLTELMVLHRPDCMAVEDIFFARNVRSALKLGHVRGVVMQAAAAQGLVVAEYTPLAVKSALTGFGRAEKAQVLHMVRVLLQLEADPETLDASDALAVAICHLHTIGAAAARGAAAR